MGLCNHCKLTHLRLLVQHVFFVDTVHMPAPKQLDTITFFFFLLRPCLIAMAMLALAGIYLQTKEDSFPKEDSPKSKTV